MNAMDRGDSMIYHEVDLSMRGHHSASVKQLRTVSTRSRAENTRPEETTRGALFGDSHQPNPDTVVSLNQEDDVSTTSECRAEVGLRGGPPSSGSRI